MRWLIISLLLINAAAFWWWQAQREARLSPPTPVRQAQEESVPRLLLLSEVPAEAAPQRRAAAEALDPGQETVAEPAAARGGKARDVAPQECLLLGGAPDRDQLRNWRAALRSADIAVAGVISEYPEQQVSAYLVSIPATADPPAVVATLAERGIEALSMESSPGEGRISAGMFRIRENALRQRRRLEELGYSAAVVPQLRERPGFWVEVRGSAGLRDRAAALLARRIPEAEPAWRPCGEAAEPPPDSDGQR